MAGIEKDIVVDVPVSIAYDQWTQFESWSPAATSRGAASQAR